jgi:hypothetical protein
MISVNVYRRAPLFALLLALAFMALPDAASASGSPALNDPSASGPVEPSAFGPSGQGGADYVHGMKWTSWGGATATGEGQVQTYSGDSVTNSPVNVTLSGLTACAGYEIYTRYDLSVQPSINPGRFWPSWKTWQFPCQVSATNFQPAPFQKQIGGDCISFGHLDFPGFESESPCFARVQWTNWSQPVAVGKGAVRGDHNQWAAELTLSDVEWCETGLNHNALSYTKITMATWGKPETKSEAPRKVHRGEDPYTMSAQEGNRLRNRVGRSGLKKTYQNDRSFAQGCIPLTAG